MGRPPVTSRAQILAGARRLIDREGWDKLTIRRLAAELGIGPTTLYHHVRDKEDLLLLLLNEYAGQIAPPTLPDEPRDRLVVAWTALHDALAAWPWAAELFTIDGFVGRLDESALQLVELSVAASIECGCTQRQAVELFRSVWYYTVGEILVRANSGRRRPSEVPPPQHRGFLGHVDPKRLPQLAAIGEQWPSIAAHDTYARGLRALVDGLLAQTEPETKPPRKACT